MSNDFLDCLQRVVLDKMLDQPEFFPIIEAAKTTYPTSGDMFEYFIVKYGGLRAVCSKYGQAYELLFGIATNEQRKNIYAAVVNSILWEYVVIPRSYDDSDYNKAFKQFKYEN